jgi:pimeloyl-ACP methyl ester carboxylesterase
MTVVLVHGNPETAAIWRPLIAELGRDDVVCLSPPGFGAPVPAGFGATMTDYREWLVAELEGLGGPVDLVGHDWGGGHVVGVALTRPDLLRSWVSDILGALDPGYVWHDFAQAWQTPGVGEEALAGMIASGPAARAELLAGLGVPADAAAELARALDDEMARCILTLYRSAAQPAMADAGRMLGAARARPGLAIHASEDHFVGTPEMHRRMAEAAGAQLVEFDGLGHWWMLQDPARGAAALTGFWSSLGT